MMFIHLGTRTRRGRPADTAKRGAPTALTPAGQAVRGLLQELQVLPDEVAADVLRIGVDQLAW